MKTKYLKGHLGFTLIEILVAMSLIGIILVFASSNLFRPVPEARLQQTTDDIISLLKEAQNKSMNSDTQGAATASEYGLHFETNNYTFFKGTTYNQSDLQNLKVKTQTNVSISTNLPCPAPPGNCNNVVFQKLSGEIVNFDQTKNTICVAEGSGRNNRLTFNLLGSLNLQNAC